VKREDRVAEQFSSIIKKGYPMSSFLILPGLSKPAAECSDDESGEADKKVFAPFVSEFRLWLKRGGLM